jgi:D-alanyl-D-alanine carboxypeptidase
MRPDVALAFDRLAAAARREAGLYLSITSAFRSDAEQARLFAAKPTPYLFPASPAVLAARVEQASAPSARAVVRHSGS